MNVILGIDIGGSTTKIVGLREDGSLLSVLRVRAEDQLTSLYGALGNYLSSNHLSLQQVCQVVLTGVGASFVDESIYGLPTRTVSEFSACGTGGLALSGAREAVVVSMGTGTAFLWAAADGQVRHLCGSGVGGGTLRGLFHKLAGVEHFRQFQELSAQGDLGKTDLQIRDISRDPASTLTPDMTAANFGKLSSDASPADLAAGTVNLVLQSIGTLSVLACSSCKTDTAILTGSLATLPQTAQLAADFRRLYGVNFIIPENAVFATAIGAALCSLKGERAL